MYPVCLDIKGKLCVIIGGGQVAERKVKALLGSGANIRLVSPEATPMIASLAGEGTIEWRQKLYSAEDLDCGLLVFAATNQREVQELIWKQAETNGQLVNVADDPDCCNFHVPAIVRRGDLTLSVSTNGKSPAVSARIRKQLEGVFGSEYDVLLTLMARIREKAASMSEVQAERKKIYKKILHGDIIEWIRAEDITSIRKHLQSVLGPDFDIDESELKPTN